MQTSSIALTLALIAAPLTAAAQSPAYPPPPPLDPPQQGVPVYAQQPGVPVYAQQPGAPVYMAPAPGPMQGGYRLTRPVLVPYEEGSPVPPGARLVTRPRIGLVVAGSTIFGSLWLLTAMAGTLASSDSSYRSGSQPELWLVLPVLGPFAYMAAEDRVSTAVGFWLALDGLAQGAGLAMLIAGIVRPAQYVAYDRVAAVRPTWSISPGFAGMPGASFRATF